MRARWPSPFLSPSSFLSMQPDGKELLVEGKITPACHPLEMSTADNDDVSEFDAIEQERLPISPTSTGFQQPCFGNTMVVFPLPFLAQAFWKGAIMGFGPCILTKVCCAPFMGDAPCFRQKWDDSGKPFKGKNGST